RTDMEGFPGRDHKPWQRRLRWRNLHTVSERGKPLGPKAGQRGDPEVNIPQGNHRAEGPALGPVWDAEPLDIYHVPRRSWEQYRTMIDNGGSSYANNK